MVEILFWNDQTSMRTFMTFIESRMKQSQWWAWTRTLRKKVSSVYGGSVPKHFRSWFSMVFRPVFSSMQKTNNMHHSPGKNGLAVEICVFFQGRHFSLILHEQFSVEFFLWYFNIVSISKRVPGCRKSHWNWMCVWRMMDRRMDSSVIAYSGMDRSHELFEVVDFHLQSHYIFQ